MNFREQSLFEEPYLSNYYHSHAQITNAGLPSLGLAGTVPDLDLADTGLGLDSRPVSGRIHHSILDFVPDSDRTADYHQPAAYHTAASIQLVADHTDHTVGFHSLADMR